MIGKDCYVRTLLSTLLAEIENTNQLRKNLPRLSRKIPRFFYAGFYCTTELTIHDEIQHYREYSARHVLRIASS